MIPSDRLTYLRNRARARDLRRFRDLVEAYFERAELDVDGEPLDWEGARAARAQIHRMLPRVLDVVQAAIPADASSVPSGTGLAANASEILGDIFGARHVEQAGQEILDVIDMALGVYEQSRYAALLRTFNPFHYVAVTLAYTVSLPRRALVAMGLLSHHPKVAGMSPADLARLEAVAARLANVEELIDLRLRETRNWIDQQAAEQAVQLEDLAERIDFTERVLTRQRAPERLEPPRHGDVNTPV